MTLKEEFKQIVEKEQIEVATPFLKKLSEEDKKALSPLLKKQYNHYGESIEIEKNKWRRRGTSIQFEILDKAAYLFFDLKTFEKYAWSPNYHKLVDEFSDIYVPKWLNQYINKFTDHDHGPRYLWLLEQTKAGRITPNRLLLIRSLTRAIYTRNPENWDFYFTPENIQKNEVTLKDHFWDFFKYETNVYYATRWVHFKNDPEKKEATWLNIICKLEKEQKLPRNRLLKEALNATNQNFNRNLIGWYVDLFNALQPTQEELLDLQPELFQTFHATQSKPVSNTLKYLKGLVKEDAFDNESFIASCSLLLVSETKSVVNSALLVLDKIALKIPSSKEEICTRVCEAFIHRDAGIQKKGAKLLLKHAQEKVDQLASILSQYEEELLSETKNSLSAFLSHSTSDSSIEEVYTFTSPLPILTEENQISFPQNIDDLVFLANQALVGKEAWHFELLPAALIKFQDDINQDNIEKFAPAYQRAYKFIYDGTGSAKVGSFENLTAHFIIEALDIFLKKIPEQSAFKEIVETHRKKELKKKKNWEGHTTPKISVENWSKYYNENIYAPFKFLFLHCLKQIKETKKSPLLSTPTHSPYWIDPLVFIQRLSTYQKEGINPNTTDWQIAISRLAEEHKEAAVNKAKALLKDEFLSMTLFALGEEIEIPAKLKYPRVWECAAVHLQYKNQNVLQHFFPDKLKRNQLIGNLKFGIHTELRHNSVYNNETKQYDKIPIDHHTLIIEDLDNEEIWSWGDDHKVFYPPKVKGRFFLPDYFFVRDFWSSGNVNDITRFFSLAPRNNGQLLSRIIIQNLHYSTFWEESAKKTVIAIAEVMLDNWRGGNAMEHLFVASALICSDGTARNLASEIWIRGVSEQNIDSRLIGQYIGKMESIEFVPLKRFNDIVQNRMFRISSVHDKALIEMLEALIPLLPAQPIRHTKKLLELYLELLSLYPNIELTKSIQSKLNEWESTKSLKAIIKKLNLLL